MYVEREAAPNDKCVDCGRAFEPGEFGRAVRPDLGPFIACSDRDACEARQDSLTKETEPSPGVAERVTVTRKEDT